MKIVIPGNLGYVGPPVVRFLRRAHPRGRIIDYDSALFALPVIGALVGAGAGRGLR